MTRRTLWGALLAIAAEATGCGGSGADTAAGSAGSADSAVEGPLEPSIPVVTGTCPTLGAGDVVFDPDGVAPRKVRVWMDDRTLGGGRLQFFFHGTGGDPGGAVRGFGQEWIDTVVAEGGIVVAPFSDPAAGQFPWWLVSSLGQDDLLVMDEIVACAVEQWGIDPYRVHLSGFSAGGLHAARASFLRSNYLASVAVYSGGLYGPRDVPADAAASNLFSAMVIHGGDDDDFGGTLDFQVTSQYYIDALRAGGRLAVECNNNLGHMIGNEQASVDRFFADHPWGAWPSPYAEGLPSDFIEECVLP